MKKIVVLLALLFSFNVYADTCDKNELARLKNIADQVELSYEYEIKKTKIDGEDAIYADYTVIVSNLNKEIKANYEKNYLLGNYYEFKLDANGVGKLSQFYDGETAVVTIRAFTNTKCSGKIIATKTIKMPYLNPYYYTNREFCNTYSDFKYCQELMETSFNEADYEKEHAKYFNAEKKIVREDVQEDDNHNYYLIMAVIVSVVLLLLMILSIILKKKKKNSL